jgi:ParB-like chromosome segregation protein Spo0J
LPTESGKVELSISGNSRLLAGVAGAVNHVGESAGMEEKARAEFVAAVENACRLALSQVTQGDSPIALSLEVLPGKIEAVLQCQMSSTSGKPAAGSGFGRELGKLDDVKLEVNGNAARVILTKKL